MDLEFVRYKNVVQVQAQGWMLGHIGRARKGSPKWKPNMALAHDLRIEDPLNYPPNDLAAVQLDLQSRWHGLSDARQRKLIDNAARRLTEDLQ